MGIFENLENLFEEKVEGIFRNWFKRPIQPVEIARRIAKSMLINKTFGVSQVIVPNAYTIHLSKPDRQNLSSIEKMMEIELRDFVAKNAKESNFHLPGDPAITFVTDETLPIGKVVVQAKVIEKSETQISDASENTIVFQRKNILGVSETSVPKLFVNVANGKPREYNLDSFPVRVGRSDPSTILVDDLNVSRQHVEIYINGKQYYVKDLDSLNGTFLNGKSIKQHILENNDIIKIGSTTIRFKV